MPTGTIAAVSNDAIREIVAPLSPEEFLKTCFEKKPLHLPAPQPHRFDRWLTLQSFHEVLTGTDAELLKLKCARDDVVDGSVSLQKALDAFRGGSTIVVNHMHLLWAPLGVACRHLEAFFYHSFQANVYYTPGLNKGFGPHFDLHDVFVLQIHGRKRWRVYAPDIELPLAEQQKTVQLDPRTQPVLEATMEPGDVLYLPRGFIHEAAANDAEPTLHVSLGMISLTWRDALLMAINDAAASHAELRASVPLSPALSAASDVPAQLEAALAAVAGELRAHTLRLARERFVLTRTALQPQLGTFVTDNNTRWSRHPLVLTDMRSHDEYVALSFQGKRLEFPREAAEAITFALGHDGEYGIADLPGPLDDVNKLRLLRYLHQEGLLLCQSTSTPPS